MRFLYPPVKPHEQGMLDVGDGHLVYWEVSGNPSGKPAVVLHGGPGSGSVEAQRRLFDPAVYRIVLFDQRGCGRSTPHVADPATDLSTNTTWHLVADIERLRSFLGIDRWLVLGGSWGATLAMAYAQRHPERVTEIVLRGVFLLRQVELDWIYGGGAGMLFPEAWAEFVSVVPPDERHDLLTAYRRLVEGPSQDRAAAAWSNWEGAAVSLLPSPGLVATYASPEFALPFARIALHYFCNGGWLEEGQLLRDAGKLAGIPGRIVQGRYDAVCPPATAWELHQAWPDSRLIIAPRAGHAVSDPGILDGLLDATDEFRTA
jgi:proline iminopeptidase